MNHGFRLVVATALTASACSPDYDRELPVPIQGEVSETGAPIGGTGRMRAIADFRATTLVLKRTRYELDLQQDPMSEFAPVDMVMAWGRAGLKGSREGVDIAQGRRRYSWNAGPEAWTRQDVKSFGLNTANWHLVPADQSVAEQMRKVDVGDVVEITGQLVSLDLTGGHTARSSTRRDDEGDGACEIVRVGSIKEI